MIFNRLEASCFYNHFASAIKMSAPKKAAITFLSRQSQRSSNYLIRVGNLKNINRKRSFFIFICTISPHYQVFMIATPGRLGRDVLDQKGTGTLNNRPVFWIYKQWVVYLLTDCRNEPVLGVFSYVFDLLEIVLRTCRGYTLWR